MTNLNDGSTDSPTSTNRTFLFEWVGIHELGISEIWPDGDAPADPTADDVMEVIRKEGGVSGILQNWNMPPQLEVDGKVVK